MSEQVILRFDNVTFEYAEDRPLLEEASFSVRTGAKLTLMGQNGAGKSTLFNLIKGDLKPKEGNVFLTDSPSIATSLQVIPREYITLNLQDYFAKAFEVKPANLEAKIHTALEAVNLDMPLDRIVGALSGGQQARLLLAFALIQEPDILLLDEPTNNLDSEGIRHLISFLVMYDKTVIVISHDADFLNCFTEGVLYLDARSKKIEVYVGDYYSVVDQIAERIEREQRLNAQLEKKIIDRKEKVNFFAHKGGKMRKLAQKLKEETEEMEENKVDVRQDDRTIREFTIPRQDIVGDLVKIHSVKIIKNHEAIVKPVEIKLRQRTKLLVSGPNGIGKSTLLRSIVSGTAEGTELMKDLVVGYYSQDFSTLDYNQNVFDSLVSVKADGIDLQQLRSIAAGFLITGDLMGHKISYLSEGQKGLLSFARLVLMRPGLLILDEPTNHINFRHIPIIANALEEYDGAMILISHMPDFVKQIEMNEYLDLGAL